MSKLFANVLSEEVHLVYECASTERIRWKFLCDVAELDTNIAEKLLQADAETFYLSVLGSPITDLNDTNMHTLFLNISLRFVMKCIRYERI